LLNNREFRFTVFTREGIVCISENIGELDMGDKTDVWQGTLALMILKTIETLGPLHGYGIARRIEQTSGNLLSLNYGTLYPALLKLEQEGSIVSEWGLSENNRKAKFYKLTRSGRKQLAAETRDWEQTTAILSRFLAPSEDSL
jgi:PadR family transcriptional regulator PadR